MLPKHFFNLIHLTYDKTNLTQISLKNVFYFVFNFLTRLFSWVMEF